MFIISYICATNYLNVLVFSYSSDDLISIQHNRYRHQVMLWWTSLWVFFKDHCNTLPLVNRGKGVVAMERVKELLELGCCDEVVVKKLIQIKDIIIFRLSMFWTYLCYILISNWRWILRQLNEHYFLKEPTCTCNSISRKPHWVILRNECYHELVISL